MLCVMFTCDDDAVFSAIFRTIRPVALSVNRQDASGRFGLSVLNNRRGPVGVPEILRRHPERQSEITAVPSPIRGGRISDVGAVLGDSQFALQCIHDLQGQLLPSGAGNAGAEDVHFDVGGGLVVTAAK